MSVQQATIPLDDQQRGASTISENPEDEHPSKKRKSDPLDSSVVCYICQLVPLPGKFLTQKAKELGVPKGPMFGALHRGETVTLGDGRQVGLDLNSPNLC